MAPRQVNIAIMFADVAGSTRLYEKLGDEIARAKVSSAINTMTGITQQNKGQVVKTIGDEVMCTFDTAEDAATAAWDMQEAFEKAAEQNTDGSPVFVRIGMHFGPAILEDDGDVFGDATNIAARMAAQAKAKQIIVTQDTLDELPSAMREDTRFVDRTPIKGKKEEMAIFEILWQAADVTHMITNMTNKISGTAKQEAALRVTYNGQTLEINRKRPDLMLGRSQSCDLTIHEKLASRQHVRIELRKDKFFIVDQSTNGTHVMFDDNPEELIHREERPVMGNGRISLGRELSKNPDAVVEFFLDS